MNVLNLRPNKAGIALASYLMNPLKSTYLKPIVLVVGLYQTHWNEITELVSAIIFSKY